MNTKCGKKKIILNITKRNEIFKIILLHACQRDVKH